MDPYKRHETIARLQQENAEMIVDMVKREQQAGEPDALEKWNANMPQPKPKARPILQPSKTELFVRALRVKVERNKREATEYRINLEKALGTVIANMRKEQQQAIAPLRLEIAQLRAELDALVGGNDGRD